MANAHIPFSRSHTSLSPLTIGGQENLSVRSCTKSVPHPFKLTAEFQIVEYLPIVREHEVAVSGDKRLIACRTQIDHSKPNMSEPEALCVEPRTVSVRSSVSHGGQH